MKKIYSSSISWTYAGTDRRGQMGEPVPEDYSEEWEGNVEGYYHNLDEFDSDHWKLEAGLPDGEELYQDFQGLEPDSDSIYTLYIDDEPVSVLFAADDGQRFIWIARVADDNSDTYRAYFDRESAEATARSYFNHLTPRERMTHSVTVEGYIIPADDPRDAEAVWSDLLIDDDPATHDPDVYEEVKA